MAELGVSLGRSLTFPCFVSCLGAARQKYVPLHVTALTTRVVEDNLAELFESKVSACARAVEDGPHRLLREAGVVDTPGGSEFNLVRHEVDDEERPTGPQALTEAPGSQVRILKVVEASADPGDVEVEEDGVGKGCRRRVGREQEVSNVGYPSLWWDCLREVISWTGSDELYVCVCV